MSGRRPLHPLSPLSPNLVAARYDFASKVGANLHGSPAMDERVHDDHTQGSGSNVSGLTSLEDDTDDFGRLMIQNARDERRLTGALRGNVQPFRKGRTHSRVGLTLDNLERNNEANGASGEYAPRRFGSSPSVSSSNSDPALRPPQEWGRKGRVRRDWLKRITVDDKATPELEQDDTLNRLDADTPRQLESRADAPLPSVEDSPLSRRSSNFGTPSSARRRIAALDRIPDWDMSLDLNEASLIASTPYAPRNTVLDDIRKREIESLKEQAVATSRLDKIREHSPEETRRRRSSSVKSRVDTLNNSASASGQASQERSSSPARLRKRTNSKGLSRSQPSLTVGEPVPNSPVVIYKSSETVGIVDRGILANAQSAPQRPGHRREDSHDLLRRLARVSSSTPSPGRTIRPVTAPARQLDSASFAVAAGVPAIVETALTSEAPAVGPPHQSENIASTAEQLNDQQDKESEDRVQPLTRQQEEQVVDADVTPMPLEPPALNAKTPVVTGAWIETPAPRTAQRPSEVSWSPSRSPAKRASPSKRSTQKQQAAQLEEPVEEPAERIEPSLPRSALRAIVQEARSSGSTRHAEERLGDSTLDSLEDLLTQGEEQLETPVDEDTLLGLGIPTTAPRTEAERQRQQELLQLHKMNDRLRTVRTGIRDTSRGVNREIKWVEKHSGTAGGQSSTALTQACPCQEDGVLYALLNDVRKVLKGLFYNPKSSYRHGLTWLSIFVIAFTVWWIAELLACDQLCHKLEASHMKGFGVKWDAPRYPFVIPTMLYRWLLRPFHFLWGPFWDVFVRCWSSVYNWLFEDEQAYYRAKILAAQSANKFSTKVLRQAHSTATYAAPLNTYEEDGSMYDDERI